MSLFSTSNQFSDREPNILTPLSVPHYVVSSHDVQAGKVSKGINWIRRFLIEDVYRSICKYKGRHISLRLAHRCYSSYHVPRNRELERLCRQVSPPFFLVALTHLLTITFYRIIHVGINATI